MGIQDIIVMIIFAACVVWIIHRTYRQVQRSKNNEGGCSGCSMGCSCSRPSAQTSPKKAQNEAPSCCSEKKEANQKTEG